MKNKKISTVLLIFEILILIGIFCFSAQTGEESGNISQNFTEKFLNFFGLRDVNVNHTEHVLRKGAHVLEYALLGAAVCALMFYIPKFSDSFYLPTICAWGFSVFYAITDEFHQSFVPGRGPSVQDVVWDGIGALIGILIVMFFRFFIFQKRKNTEKS